MVVIDKVLIPEEVEASPGDWVEIGAKLYKMRWQVELFFKWIKQHLRIKSFYGTSANAVKTQVGSRSPHTSSWPS